jgi:hypothetical protein
MGTPVGSRMGHVKSKKGALVEATSLYYTFRTRVDLLFTFASHWEMPRHAQRRGQTSPPLDGWVRV